MASSNDLILGLILVVNLVIPSLATVYTVGDSSGWATGVDYSTWTSGKTFVGGDSLVFNYGGTGHTVDEVTSNDYKTCTIGNSLSTDSSGTTTIALKTAGSHYYICGVIGHCGNGMKLTVNVKTAGTSSAPTGTPSSDKGSSATTNITTTTETPSSTVSDNSSGATLFPVVAMLIVTWVSLFLML
ncbi:blue copper protein-like [Quillaja saponaria]|uniref:Blue copper protein-like n=1 Tax=Quillaja saponaria TaxID=32244 RepID=A0AAD7LJD9_QUISA|nr:blue copper protein-like [Quillaja saponaria]